MRNNYNKCLSFDLIDIGKPKKKKNVERKHTQQELHCITLVLEQPTTIVLVRRSNRSVNQEKRRRGEKTLRACVCGTCPIRGHCTQQQNFPIRRSRSRFLFFFFRLSSSSSLFSPSPFLYPVSPFYHPLSSALVHQNVSSIDRH
eukprot:TRINITY_DN8279_c0_g1_i1.p1 TRINITY_DN8279_c0_g1~~TRINITY_DN8279_c0_g1_i1.p1  ORF type:complete len:144 (-),score=5.55 TRINITY_DN8279_c0_g1_i1:194-625(-)